MRPRTLTLEGFRSHQHQTEFDFRGRSLFAIVGPTGSGKSSILDGIAYALYGRTPRLQKEQSRLICSRADRALVKLEFSANASDYSISRSLPRKGKSQHLLVDETSGDKIMGERAVTEKVEELVHLDFGGFCSSVMLAQNKFSEFLTAAPTQRARILKGVFRLEEVERLREVARTKREEIAVQLGVLVGERRTIPEDAVELLEAARADRQRAEERATELGKALPEEEQIDESLREAAQRANAAAAALERAQSALEQLPEISKLEALAAAEAEGVVEKQRATAAYESAGAVAVAATAAAAALEREVGSERALLGARAGAERLLERTSELAGLRTEAAGDEATLTGLEAEANRQAKVETDAEAAAARSSAHLDEVVGSHAAHALRAELVPGEPCPVCAQPVASLPQTRAPEALARAKGAKSEAQRAWQEARAAVTEARTAVDVARVESAGRAERIAKLEARVLELNAELAAAIGAKTNLLAEIDERLERLARMREHVDSATEKRDQTSNDLESCKLAAEQFRRRRREIAAVLIGVAGRVELKAPDVDDDAGALAGHAERARLALESSASDARAAADKAMRAAQEAAEARAELLARLGLEVEDSIAGALAGARGDARLCAQRIEDLGTKVKRAAELDRMEAGSRARGRLFDQLTDDLADRHFLSFLLEDRRRLLSELGSERLREMTGRYRFDDDAGFDVVDELNADRRRGVDTLSGGETFLASLALALALAETVSRHGGMLNCFFLDEGFGSLDAESLDLALDGIERIVSADRLIGLVSHVQGLATRVEDRIELDKDAEGMTQVKSGASL